MLAADAMLKLAKLIMDVDEGTATGGNATTLADTTLGATEDDFYNGGTIWFLSGNNAGKSAVISDYTNSTRTFTFTTPGAACAAGNLYAACRNVYSRTALLTAINMGLLDVGPVTSYNDTVTVVADTEEYTLPSGVSGVVKVEVANAAAQPYEWATYFQWQEAGGKLIFDPNYGPSTVGRIIRIWYNAPHAEVDSDADEISSQIPAPLLLWKAAVYALNQRANNMLNADPTLEVLLKNANERALEMLARYPKRLMARTPRYNV